MSIYEYVVCVLMIYGHRLMLLLDHALVAIIPAQAAALADAFVSGQMEKDRRGAAKKKKRKLRQKCSKCGEGPHRNDAIFCWSCGELLD